MNTTFHVCTPQQSHHTQTSSRFAAQQRLPMPEIELPPPPSPLHSAAAACSEVHMMSLLACCSVLQCVAMCCSILLRFAMYGGNVIQSVLQCVAVCCSALQCVAVCCRVPPLSVGRVRVMVCCSVLQCVLVCCSSLECVTVYHHHQWVE